MNYKILFNIYISLTFFTTLSACAQEEAESDPGFNEATFKGLEWRGIGPALMSGRISDIEIDPRDPSTWYVAVGSGGVWKTANRGNTWTPLFDEQASYSIGDIAIAQGSDLYAAGTFDGGGGGDGMWIAKLCR